MFPNKDNKQDIMINKIIDVYEIDNNIYDFKDLFNNIQLTNNIIAV